MKPHAGFEQEARPSLFQAFPELRQPKTQTPKQAERHRHLLDAFKGLEDEAERTSPTAGDLLFFLHKSCTVVYGTWGFSKQDLGSCFSCVFSILLKAFARVSL